MATYFMFGKYSLEGLKGISASRTQQATSIIQNLGGKVNSIHALLGNRDIVFVADLPNAEAAVKASIGLAKLTGIGFSTQEAIPVEKFDKLAG